MTDITKILHTIGLDTPADLKRGSTRTKYEIMVALLWVLRCEQNGSYDDKARSHEDAYGNIVTQGGAIRKADMEKLQSLQKQLHFDTGLEGYAKLIERFGLRDGCVDT